MTALSHIKLKPDKDKDVFCNLFSLSVNLDFNANEYEPAAPYNPIK